MVARNKPKTAQTTQSAQSARSAPRVPLSRERVLRAAIKIADEGGIQALTMRRLAEEVGAEAMSLYYHVANKEEVLDGIADAIVDEINDVVGRIDLPATGADWKKTVRRRILSAREILLRHPWAPGVFETRAGASPAVLRYLDGLLGLMRAGGFSNDLCHHALHALGSRALGFTQELFDPGNGAAGEDAAATFEEMAAQLPHLVGMVAEVAHDDPDNTLGWCDDQTEFEFGLDVILDGLDRMRETA
ncbi:MAG TPA: TetR/AcrR family transcriptional regulator C-terminal domain-containing protein [Streptosporangiaceae bacterium]|nr:TetR/AcrR family transcriptional regulator C-terminal domain-containing protein [Streptosporangiaceae bacterium]